MLFMDMVWSDLYFTCLCQCHCKKGITSGMQSSPSAIQRFSLISLCMIHLRKLAQPQTRCHRKRVIFQPSWAMFFVFFFVFNWCLYFFVSRSGWGEWYCVGTQVACEITSHPQGHWTDKWPTTNGGKPRWKTMIKKPAERLVELLESHGILDHCCQICPNAHGLWANHLGGPRHYQNLYHFPKEDLVGKRFQPWDLPGRVGYAGRWGWVGTGLNHIQHVTYAYDATYCIYMIIYAACMLFGILYCIMYISLCPNTY